jgi:hypothetical protein
MNATATRKELLKQLERLPPELQRQVLEFSKALASAVTKRVPGRRLLHFAGTLTEQEALEMARAIDAGCERVDANDW